MVFVCVCVHVYKTSKVAIYLKDIRNTGKILIKINKLKCVENKNVQQTQEYYPSKY